MRERKSFDLWHWLFLPNPQEKTLQKNYQKAQEKEEDNKKTKDNKEENYNQKNNTQKKNNNFETNDKKENYNKNNKKDNAETNNNISETDDKKDDNNETRDYNETYSDNNRKCNNDNNNKSNKYINNSNNNNNYKYKHKHGNNSNNSKNHNNNNNNNISNNSNPSNTSTTNNNNKSNNNKNTTPNNNNNNISGLRSISSALNIFVNLAAATHKRGIVFLALNLSNKNLTFYICFKHWKKRERQIGGSHQKCSIIAASKSLFLHAARHKDSQSGRSFEATSHLLQTSGFWPRVRARALRAPVFLGS
jgi:hypothetical protein